MDRPVRTRSPRTPQPIDPGSPHWRTLGDGARYHPLLCNGDPWPLPWPPPQDIAAHWACPVCDCWAVCFTRIAYPDDAAAEVLEEAIEVHEAETHGILPLLLDIAIFRPGHFTGYDVHVDPLEFDPERARLHPSWMTPQPWEEP